MNWLHCVVLLSLIQIQIHYQILIILLNERELTSVFYKQTTQKLNYLSNYNLIFFKKLSQ